MEALNGKAIKISVIVTVHNAERYLKACIESVLEQTFSEIEIICIDGGSTDNSPYILKKYAAYDNRIRIINDVDTSYGHKVNQGIQRAEGKYISVLESDDMYLPQMLECLYQAAELYDVDFVNADYLEFWEVNGRQYQRPINMYPKQDYNKIMEIRKHPEEMRQILRYWTGLFRKDFLLQERIRMNESPGASFQDMSFRFLTSALAETSYHIDVPVYLYRIDNPFSSVHDAKKAVVIVDEYDFLKKEIEKRRIENPYIWRNYYLWKYNDFYGNLTRFDEISRQPLLELCYQELSRDNDILGQLNMEAYSPIIKRLLDKPQKDMVEEIESRFQTVQSDKYRQERMYFRLENHKIVIFGCGTLGQNVFRFLFSVRSNVCCFSDNNPDLWKTEKDGCVILAPEVVVRKFPDALFIIANKLHANDMVEQLKAMGVSEEMIFIY